MLLYSDKDDYTVFVNNLPFTVTETMIRDHFKAAVGDLIEEVRLIRGPTG